MQVTKEQVDPCTVALDIKIEPDIVSKAFGQAYREFGQFTNVPGFRPGKAPRRMVERYEISFIFSSHDPEVIKAADDTIFLKDGVIQGIRRKGQEATP